MSEQPNDFVAFMMDQTTRAMHVERNEFYARKANELVLERFTDVTISSEANRAYDESLTNSMRKSGPDDDDYASKQESASEQQEWHRQLMFEMRDNVSASIVAGLFQEWEKSLRKWLVTEMAGWPVSEKAKKTVWMIPVCDILKLLDIEGWVLRDADYFPVINACRLVANVQKHGDGDSLTKLKTKHPEYLTNPATKHYEKDEIVRRMEENSIRFMGEEQLFISQEHIREFTSAITEFWQDVPDRILGSQLQQIPDRLIKPLKETMSVHVMISPK